MHWENPCRYRTPSSNTSVRVISLHFSMWNFYLLAFLTPQNKEECASKKETLSRLKSSWSVSLLMAQLMLCSHNCIMGMLLHTSSRFIACVAPRDLCNSAPAMIYISSKHQGFRLLLNLRQKVFLAFRKPQGPKSVELEWLSAQMTQDN